MVEAPTPRASCQLGEGRDAVPECASTRAGGPRCVSPRSSTAPACRITYVMQSVPDMAPISDESVGGPPAPDLFVREDVAKPENRVNLALFSLMLVPAFRRWFLGRLNLD